MVEQAYRYIYFLNGVGRISIVDLGISLNGEKENRLRRLSNVSNPNTTI